MTTPRQYAGRAKRHLQRKIYERNIGKQYKLWLKHTQEQIPNSVNNAESIAVIVPVYNPPTQFLIECLDSVVNQTARNWQLVVSDDGSSNPDTINYLNSFKEQHQNDPRITVITNPNGGISAAQNKALERVTTTYFGWLDHDDQLNPTCVEEFSTVIEQADIKPKVVYSDEDKINAGNEHFELYCKPDFSPELLLTQMYLCHFTVFNTEMVRAEGGFRSEMDGAQDFDLALRLLPQLTNLNTNPSVLHIPKPLYHWRSWSESTAQSIDAKPWAQQAGQRAQQAHLDRTFDGGEAKPSAIKGLNEVHPQIPTHTRVSVIIPTIGTTDKGQRMVERAIASLRANTSTAIDLEIIAVTTGPLDPIPGATKQVVYNPTQGFNFSEAINLGRANAQGEYLLLLNDDTTVKNPHPIERMLELAQIPEVAITGAKLTYPNERLQHVGMIMLPSGPTHPFISKPARDFGYFGSTLTPRNYSAVTAAAMLTRASVFDQLGGFDTQFARDFNDVDFCLKARAANYRIAWTPYAHFTHHEGASITRKSADLREQELFAQRWNTGETDPYYSPALNQDLPRMYEVL